MIESHPVWHSGLNTGLDSGTWPAMVALEIPIAGKLLHPHWYGAAFAFAALFPFVGYVLWWCEWRD